MFKQLIGSLAARYLPGLGFEPIRPTRIVPVYFPAWVVDGELQTSITYNDTQVRNICAYASYILNCNSALSWPNSPTRMSVSNIPLLRILTIEE